MHDDADVPESAPNLGSVQLRLDENRLISDASLLLTASLADRLGIEQLVNESVRLDSRAPSATLPGRKVLSLVHGLLAGADSIDDIDVLRTGRTGMILGSRVMAPSTLGTFSREFTCGHVRQLSHVLHVALARVACRRRTQAWAVGDRPRQLRWGGAWQPKQGASYGYTSRLGYHRILAVRADTS